MRQAGLRRFGIAVVVIVAAVAALGASTAVAGSAAALADQRTITVNGTGIVTSVPNQADFTFGVSTNGSTATGALSANATQMSKVIGVLKALGIAGRNIQTAQISLSPNMNRAGTAVVSYAATNSVTARTNNIPRSGKIIDGVVRAGANLVGGPSLTRSDQQALSRRALTAAIADARARATVIAAAAHVTLGRVRSVTEANGGPITSSADVAAKSFATTPVEAGTIKTEADVTVTFDIA
jgi:uncharacterized protein YggE